MEANRRKFIQYCSGSITAGFAGCSNIVSPEPEKGEIMLITEENNRDQQWAAGETMRIIGRKDGSESFNETYILPVSSLDLTVEPDTYQVSILIGGEEIETYEWSVTECKSQLLLDFGNERKDGIRIDTSNC